jgi:hypothetical protein
MVTATSAGPRFIALRQRAASHKSATESGPPETARIKAGADCQSANSCFACEAEMGAESSSVIVVRPV